MYKEHVQHRTVIPGQQRQFTRFQHSRMLNLRDFNLVFVFFITWRASLVLSVVDAISAFPLLSLPLPTRQHLVEPQQDPPPSPQSLPRKRQEDLDGWLGWFWDSGPPPKEKNWFPLVFPCTGGGGSRMRHPSWIVEGRVQALLWDTLGRTSISPRT